MEVHATGVDANHSAVYLDWTNPHSGSYVAAPHDIPSGSRICMAIKSSNSGQETYYMSTTFAWDYSSVGY